MMYHLQPHQFYSQYESVTTWRPFPSVDVISFASSSNMTHEDLKDAVWKWPQFSVATRLHKLLSRIRIWWGEAYRSALMHEVTLHSTVFLQLHSLNLPILHFSFTLIELWTQLRISNIKCPSVTTIYPSMVTCSYSSTRVYLLPSNVVSSVPRTSWPQRNIYQSCGRVHGDTFNFPFLLSGCSLNTNFWPSITAHWSCPYMAKGEDGKECMWV